MTVVTGSLKEFVGQTSASIVLLTLVLSEYTKRWHTQQQSRGILRSARNCSTVLWRNLRSARFMLPVFNSLLLTPCSDTLTPVL